MSFNLLSSGTLVLYFIVSFNNFTNQTDRFSKICSLFRRSTSRLRIYESVVFGPGILETMNASVGPQSEFEDIQQHYGRGKGIWEKHGEEDSLAFHMKWVIEFEKAQHAQIIHD